MHTHLLVIPFNQRIRAYVNRPNGVNFEELEEATSATTTTTNNNTRGGNVGIVSSGKPQADFFLQEGTVGVTEYPVSISRFQNVNSITLVVVSLSNSIIGAHLAAKSSD